MQSHSAEDRYDEGPGWSWRIGPTGRQRPTPLATSTPKALDRITRLAGENLDIPAVCATLVGGGGELVASCYGLDVPDADARLASGHQVKRVVGKEDHRQ